jgi:rSAM/selenodomain-associated transferase 1
MRPTVVLMLKEPRPGRAKTRLGRDIGMGPAARWFRKQALHTIARLRDPRWTLVLAVSPDAEGMTSRIWPGDLPKIPQGRGDLGDRMGRILRSMPSGPVLIVGSDIPGLSRRLVSDAVSSLCHADAVLGPAADGGYWLIGLKRVRAVAPYLFEGVRWSSEHALADTIQTLGTDRVVLVATLSDVDTVEDL